MGGTFVVKEYASGGGVVQNSMDAISLLERNLFIKSGNAVLS